MSVITLTGPHINLCGFVFVCFSVFVSFLFVLITFCGTSQPTRSDFKAEVICQAVRVALANQLWLSKIHFLRNIFRDAHVFSWNFVVYIWITGDKIRITGTRFVRINMRAKWWMIFYVNICVKVKICMCVCARLYMRLYFTHLRLGVLCLHKWVLLIFLFYVAMSHNPFPLFIRWLGPQVCLNMLAEHTPKRSVHTHTNQKPQVATLR